MAYKQISMAELDTIPKNGYKVFSTFSGCGGSSLGYKLAGYEVIGALECVPQARDAYAKNFPNTPILFKDIREVHGEDIFNLTGLKKGELDIMDGSPPCCPFSMQGVRDENWGKVVNYSSIKQRTDDLFFEYARLVNEVQPKVFVAENVKGLTVGKAKAVLDEILKTFQDYGYSVVYDVLNAENYGVPQARERCIFVGVRKDLVKKYKVRPSLPVPSFKKITTEEAIGDLIDKGSDMPLNEVDNRDVQLMHKFFHAGTTQMDVKNIIEEQKLDHIFESNFYRDRWKKPYYTIRQHHTRPFHPVVDRYMSIWEAKRIQTFPDDFILDDSPVKNWERIGRAVPPNLMKKISENIQKKILDKIRDSAVE